MTINQSLGAKTKDFDLLSFCTVILTINSINFLVVFKMTVFAENSFGQLSSEEIVSRKKKKLFAESLLL